MPLDGSGFYSLPTPAFPAVPNTLIASADFNTVLNDVAQALSNCLFRDGQAIPNDDFDLGNNKIIRLASGTAPTDAVNFSQFSALETSVGALETSVEALETSLGGLETSVEALEASVGGVAGLIVAIFPVGAIYITAGNTNPSTFLGGTWAQIAEGRTLIGVGTLGSDAYAEGATGGAARVTLNVDEIPQHSHTASSAGSHAHGTNINEGQESGTGTGSYQMTNVTAYAGDEIQSTSAGSHTHTISSVGGGTAHENRMPYLAVYFWQRTA